VFRLQALYLFVGHQCYPTLIYLSHASGTFARGLVNSQQSTVNSQQSTVNSQQFSSFPSP
ncbi:hypothetical protein, partial [Calothrix parietina]